MRVPSGDGSKSPTMWSPVVSCRACLSATRDDPEVRERERALAVGPFVHEDAVAGCSCARVFQRRSGSSAVKKMRPLSSDHLKARIAVF